jgi:all-trans-8'-apo-beta-carotenal 15,15'-oxygenase
MVRLSSPTQTGAWAKAVLHPATEFAPTSLPVLSGAIPKGLRGSLYRNGPARLERGGQRVGHWFDGDGAILGVHFTDAGATGLYRYIQTAGYQAEEQVGHFIFAGYGMTPPGKLWQRFGKDVKNVANTSVLALPDKLLALWEGGKPHALDLQTLETIGQDDLGGLDGKLAYSAHPKRDLHTGDIYNFCVTFGKGGTLQVYRSDRTGKIQQQTAIALKGLPLLHDFVLAGQYLIFFIPPVRMNPLPALAMFKSFSDCLEWKPDQGTQVLVLDRDTLEVVSRSEADPWYQWHFGNGYVDATGTIMVDLVRYEDFQTNQYLKEVATGETHTAAKGTLWQLQLQPQTGKVLSMQQVVDRACEFPIVPPQQVGQSHRHTYLATHRAGVDFSKELFSTIARYDYQTDTLTEANLDENCYPMEPIYAPDACDPDQGWIVTVVFDGNRDRSEVWVFDSDRLADAPVCRLELPSIIPLGFHGTWKPA